MTAIRTALTPGERVRDMARFGLDTHLVLGLFGQGEGSERETCPICHRVVVDGAVERVACRRQSLRLPWFPLFDYLICDACARPGPSTEVVAWMAYALLRRN